MSENLTINVVSDGSEKGNDEVWDTCSRRIDGQCKVGQNECFNGRSLGKP